MIKFRKDILLSTSFAIFFLSYDPEKLFGGQSMKTSTF